MFIKLNFLKIKFLNKFKEIIKKNSMKIFNRNSMNAQNS